MGVFAGSRRLSEGSLDITRAMTGSLRGKLALGFLSLALPAMMPSSIAEVTYRVTFADSDGLLAPWHAQIESHLLAAGSLWSERLLGSTELWIEVRPGAAASDVPCRSFTWSYVETLENAIDIFETGASIHVRNGFPAATFDPDIVVEINPVFAENDLWFDPEPMARTETVDVSRIDAVSQFVRSLGRAFAFDGWIDGDDGTFPGNSRSTFDRLLTFDGIDFYLNGANANSVYQNQIPMTFGNPFHLGNEAPRPGVDLLGDVMNGLPLSRGVRYTVSDLDFAILQDARVPIVLPCPCDLNHDALIDDVDFIAFTDAYDVYDCADPAMPANCPCDFNTDAMVDDSDYLIFFISYEQLLCP